MIPRVHLVVVLVLFLMGCGVSIWFQDKLPDPCPIHWNLYGQADDYGSPMVAAWIMPVATLLVGGILFGLPLLGPFRSNIESFKLVYGRLCVIIVLTLLAIHVVFMLEAYGVHMRMGPTIGIIIGLLYMMLGNWMGKIRRNLYIGIRTPWTIVNDVVWEKTHRVGGRLFVACGLLTVAVCPWAPDWACFGALIGGTIVVAVWSMLYSLVCYRRHGGADEMEHRVDA